jgi:hypothetical protein
LLLSQLSQLSAAVFGGTDLETLPPFKLDDSRFRVVHAQIVDPGEWQIDGASHADASGGEHDGGIAGQQIVHRKATS